jgi:excisionase family DNA binding protein
VSKTVEVTAALRLGRATAHNENSRLRDLKWFASYLHINLEKARQLAASGDAPAIRLGGSWRFDPASIDVWIENQAQSKEKAV